MMRATLLFIVLAVAVLPDGSYAGDGNDSAQAHQQLERILQQPIYQAWRLRQEGHLPQVDTGVSDRLKQWLTAALKPIGDVLRWLFRSNSRSNVSFPHPSDMLPTVLKTIAWIMLAVLVLFLAILLARTIGRNQLSGTSANILSRQQVNAALESGDALALGTGQWMDEARRLAAEQNFRAVYRALYLALLSGLHSAGKIEHSQNRTNWMYVQQYRGPVDERTMFGELTELFDRVWYGRLDNPGADIESLRRKVASLTGAPRSGAAT